MELTSTKTSISTCVCVASISSQFNIESIFNNIKIDDTVLGIKYHNQIRGCIKNTNSFFNQATMRIFVHKYNKEVNLKIFGNGKFQISGIKNILQAYQSIICFLEKIKNIYGEKMVDILIIDNIVYNKTEYEKYINTEHTRFNSIKIYGFIDNKYSVIGERKGNDFIINKIKVIVFEDFFIEIAHKDHIKRLFDKNGCEIGYCKFNLKRKRKNLILFGCKFIKTNDFTYMIYDKYNNLLGEQIIILTSKISKQIEKVKSIPIVYRSIINEKIFDDISNKKYNLYNNFNLRFTNINCNFALNLEKNNLNKETVHDILTSKYKMNSYYKPDSKYQALNIKFYYDKNMNIVPYSLKNYTYRFTALIFQNGKIILCGCTSKTQIITVKKMIIELFTKHYKEFINIKDNCIYDSTDNNISIWDLL